MVTESHICTACQGIYDGPRSARGTCQRCESGGNEKPTALSSKDVVLLDCPFCGGVAETDSQQAYRAIGTGNIGYAAAVYCTGSCSAQMSLCYADVPDLPRERVLEVLIENWNRRRGAVETSDQRLARALHVIDEAGKLSDWINRARWVITELMAAYQRRIRSDCNGPEQLAKEPWRCAEYICAERLLADQPKAVVEIRPEEPRETTEDEDPCVSHVAMKGYERVLGEIRDHSTDKWAAGLAREVIGPAEEPRETAGKWVRLNTEDIPQNAPVMMRRAGSPQIPMWEVWQPLEPPEQLPLSSAKSTRRDMDRWFDGKPEKAK